MCCKYNFEIFGILFCLVFGMLSGLNMDEHMQWYETLIKPHFNPPNWIFGPVWTILYILIGVVLGALLRKRSDNKILLILFLLQFALNVIWTPLFFGFKRIDLALLDLLSICILSFILLIKLRKNLKLFLLMLPYFLWVSFAYILNLYIYLLNT